MNKLIPFTQFVSAKKNKEFFSLSKTSVVIDSEGIPVGFVFGRDAFISFLETIDETFEKKVNDLQKAYDNPAGNLIDLIEERMPVNTKFVKELKKSVEKTEKQDWIPLDEVMRTING